MVEIKISATDICVSIQYAVQIAISECCLWLCQTRFQRLKGTLTDEGIGSKPTIKICKISPVKID